MQRHAIYLNEGDVGGNYGEGQGVLPHSGCMDFKRCVIELGIESQVTVVADEVSGLAHDGNGYVC